MHKQTPYDTELDCAEYAVQALDALSELLRVTIFNGEDISRFESGVTLLFAPHIRTLNEFHEHLRAELKARTTEAAKAVDDAAETGSDRVRTIRRDLISEALTKGIDPGEIASAMNMHRTAVENVKRRLRGEAGFAPDDRAAVNGYAHGAASGRPFSFWKG